MNTTNTRARFVGACALVWLLAFLAQWPLIANPGYFSHDELQWASFAVLTPTPWVSWLDITAFQYRPLTFNLWLWLSRRLFDTPQLFHALLVAWGAGNAALLCCLARRLGVAVLPAAAGAVAFALSAYATFVHGWVGTMADLAWVSCALLAGCLVASGARPWMRLAGTVLLTLVALLAKEAAVAIPAVLGVAWLLAPTQRTRWLHAAIASGVVVAVYLALRLGILLHADGEPAQYHLDFALVPRRWLEYQLFAFLPNAFEVFNTLQRGLHGSTVLAGVLWLGVAAACWRSHWRLAAFFLLGGAAALAPVLPLGGSSNQYGYGFAALVFATVAAAWPHAPRWGRVAIGLGAVACLWHGVNVMRTMRDVGEVQAVFSPALADAVHAHGGTPLRLRVAVDGRPWIFQRLTHEIPSYRGVPIGDRVQLVEGDAPADAVITAEGRIAPL